MPAPKADAARCDLFGCGNLATTCTDGSEVDKHPRPTPDGKPRKAIANINVCDHHTNYPFSDDAVKFATSDLYKGRK